MSILDKHPGPWRYDEELREIEDANGIVVVLDACDSVTPLIIAAPELLTALRACVTGEPGAISEGVALIARIEGK